ncbi:MAG TPA: ABC transporter permease [Clostridia bacterium]|nr:ABC transporter permease [Clostridia bacterium]
MKEFFKFLFRVGRARSVRAEMQRMRAREFFSHVYRNKTAFVGSMIVLLFALVAIVGQSVVRFDLGATGASGAERWLSPSPSHWLGTDHLGRDLFDFLVAGARVSMLVGAVATAISMVIGTVVGVVSGYFGRWIDIALMRLTDFMLCIPWLPLCMVLAAILGSSLVNIILVIGLTGWAGSARLVRAQTLSVKEMAYVERTVSIGAKSGHIMMKHILPNVFPVVFANTVLSAAAAISTETTLSFLGLGDTSRPSWGMILYYANSVNAVAKGAWWYFLPAGVCVVLVVLGLTLMGYAFDEILNPRLKER